ncbi:MAG: hypothetical protein ACOX2O_01395 [Bdellovibrionota bacterium]|jgi:hypothetical protein
MDKKERRDSIQKEETFEMIELAIEDMEILARAFNMIDNMCQDLAQDPETQKIPADVIWN